MAACHAWQGNDGQAAAAAAEVLRLKPDFTATAFCDTLFYTGEDDLAHIRDGLIKAGLPD
jgi:adenylate cyclase